MKKAETSLPELLPVRLVSHHLRSLGLLMRDLKEDTLVLEDLDNTNSRTPP